MGVSFSRLKSSFNHVGIRTPVTRGVLPRWNAPVPRYCGRFWSINAGWALPPWYAGALLFVDPLKKLLVFGSERPPLANGSMCPLRYALLSMLAFGIML